MGAGVREMSRVIHSASLALGKQTPHHHLKVKQSIKLKGVSDESLCDNGSCLMSPIVKQPSCTPQFTAKEGKYFSMANHEISCGSIREWSVFWQKLPPKRQ